MKLDRALLTWTQTILGSNWPLTLNPPSIAIPSMGLDFLILTRRVRRTCNSGFRFPFSPLNLDLAELRAGLDEP